MCPARAAPHVAFRVADLDAATDQLTRRGVTLLEPRVTNAPLDRASVLLADPDGNVVELTEVLAGR